MSASDSVASNFYAEVIGSTRKEPRTISRERFKSVMALCEVSVDFLTCAVGIFAAHVLCASLRIGGYTQYSIREITAASIVFGLLVVLLLHRDGAYRGDGGLLQIRETERAIRFPSQSLLLLLIINILFGLNFSCSVFLTAVFLIPSLLILQKQIFFSIVRKLQLRDYGVDRVVIYGAGEAGRSVVSTLLHAPRLGFHPVTVIEDNPALVGGCIFGMGYRRCGPVPVQPGPITPALLKSYRCNVLMVVAPNLSSEELNAATNAAKQAGLGVTFLYGPATQERQWTESIDIDGLLLTSLRERVVPWHYAVAKRMGDIVGACLLLVLLAPLFLLIAILIRLDSHGPALFVQKRVGRNGELFNMYKFRSMHTDARRYAFSPTESSDPRITRVGRLLRKVSLDELPQLINVLLGNMSLVGPRPEMPFVVERYNVQQRQRLQVSPGITGLWQLSADRAYPIHQNIHYDLYYIRNRTLFMDMAILIHTLLFAMRGGI